MSVRVALVTGGSRGIGKAVSLKLAADGFQVGVGFVSRSADAADVVDRIRTNGGAALALEAEVAEAKAVNTMIERLLQHFGRIDVLVNNAGIALKATTASLPEDEWDRVLDVNLKGAFLCSQAVIPSMIAQGGGRIVHVASIAGQTGGAIGPHYAASKAGLIGLTRFMARELGPMKITVNAVAPSGIVTEMLTTIGPGPNPQRPVGRTGIPDDVAAAVSYLVSDQAGYITGQTLAVNGGSFIG